MLGGSSSGLTGVKNKQPASMQITAEQILREAHERQEDGAFSAPKQKISDPEELAVYRLRERKKFEDRLRMSRNAIGTWLKYASFEEAQRDFERARSVYERALDVDHRNSTLWLKYAEMEMRNRHINAARNVWDRAVTLMPRIDQFWFKYIYMEEMLGNVSGARALFDRWTEWEPDDHAWTSYVRLELRANQPERARGVFERYVQCHNLPKGWIKWAKFEEKQAETARCREVFERALQELDERDHTEEIFIAFAQFEERAKEAERARAIYKCAPRHPCPKAPPPAPPHTRVTLTNPPHHHPQVRARHAAQVAGAGALQEVRPIREATGRPRGDRGRHPLEAAVRVRGGGAQGRVRVRHLV
jgi:crooked neck